MQHQFLLVRIHELSVKGVSAGRFWHEDAGGPHVTAFLPRKGIVQLELKHNKEPMVASTEKPCLSTGATFCCFASLQSRSISHVLFSLGYLFLLVGFGAGAG